MPITRNWMNADERGLAETIVPRSEAEGFMRRCARSGTTIPALIPVHLCSSLFQTVWNV
jgi:hypothetical protein